MANELRLGTQPAGNNLYLQFADTAFGFVSEQDTVIGRLPVIGIITDSDSTYGVGGIVGVSVYGSGTIIDSDTVAGIGDSAFVVGVLAQETVVFSSISTALAYLEFVMGRIVQDGVIFSTGVTWQPTYRLHDVLSFVASPSVGIALSKMLTETLSLSDTLAFITKLMASDGLTLTDDPTGSVARALLLAETLAVTAGVATTVELSKVLLESMAFEEAVSAARAMTVQETVQLGDALTSAIEAALTAQETLNLAAEIRSSFVIIASDSLEISASLVSTLEVALRARDGIAFIGSLPLQDGDYQAWVMNTDTTGTSSYTNFPMESLFTHKGVPYGLTSTGLYRLEGDDDDGTSIDAVVATGDLNFGTMIEKNATHAYLYLTQNGEVVLRTITSRQGTRTETYYQVLDRTTESDDDASYRKVKLGMGAKGTWWRFELASVDGASFDLNGAEVRYVALTRRGSWR